MIGSEENTNVTPALQRVVTALARESFSLEFTLIHFEKKYQRMITLKEESVASIHMLQKQNSSELLRLRKMLQYLPAIFYLHDGAPYRESPSDAGDITVTDPQYVTASLV